MKNHLLGLCPLLAVSQKISYSLCLGLCTAIVVVCAGLLAPYIARYFSPTNRLVVTMLIIGTLVGAIEVILAAFFFELYQILGLFVPLIITNCAILAHCESLANNQGWRQRLHSGIRTGMGIVGVLVAVGAAREIVGHGTVLSDIHLFIGEWSKVLVLDVSAYYGGLTIALAPMGAFFSLALVWAIGERLRIKLAPGASTGREAKLNFRAKP